MLAEHLHEPFDLILVCCKAYDLEGAMTSFAPAVGASTAIVPLLNGMRHLDWLDAHFGAEHVLGGQCLISAALDLEGRILHLNPDHELAFGERDGSLSPRARAIAAALGGAKFSMRLSEQIVYEMWQKWVFVAAIAGITCLMRATVGNIASAGAGGIAHALLDECVARATRSGFAPRREYINGIRKVLANRDSRLAASMFRDVERGAPTEADHILGDLLTRGGPVPQSLLLQIAYAHLKIYAARRNREIAQARA